MGISGGSPCGTPGLRGVVPLDPAAGRSDSAASRLVRQLYRCGYQLAT